MIKLSKYGLWGCILVVSGTCSASQLYDPTRPKNRTEITPVVSNRVSHLKLTSIMNAGGRYSAIINHKQVHVGSKIGGLKVTHISDNKVTLSNGQTLQLSKVIQLN